MIIIWLDALVLALLKTLSQVATLIIRKKEAPLRKFPPSKICFLETKRSTEMLVQCIGPVELYRSQTESTSPIMRDLWQTPRTLILTTLMSWKISNSCSVWQLLILMGDSRKHTRRFSKQIMINFPAQPSLGTKRISIMELRQIHPEWGEVREESTTMNR